MAELASACRQTAVSTLKYCLVDPVKRLGVRTRHQALQACVSSMQMHMPCNFMLFARCQLPCGRPACMQFCPLGKGSPFMNVGFVTRVSVTLSFHQAAGHEPVPWLYLADASDSGKRVLRYFVFDECMLNVDSDSAGIAYWLDWMGAIGDIALFEGMYSGVVPAL